jgi:hypothetical protein
MLSKETIQNVILENIFKPATPNVANVIAAQLQLPPGSVILGEKTIAITEGKETRHIQIGADGRSIVFVDPNLV